MKLQIDFSNRIIKVEGTVNLGKLLDQLEEIKLPGGWKNYALETNTVIYNWTNPVTYPVYIPYDRTPVYPWWDPYIITCDASANNNTSVDWGDYEVNYKGIYNVEIK